MVSDDEFDCAYELLIMEEALRQFDESKKTRLASRDHVSLTAPESYMLMPIRETLIWKEDAAEPSLEFNVSSGEAIVQRLCGECDVEINVRMNHIDWLERGLIEKAVGRLNNEVAVTDSEELSAKRTTLIS